MDKPTPPSGNPIPAYRRYFVIFAMAGMAVFFVFRRYFSRQTLGAGSLSSSTSLSPSGLWS